MIFFTTQTISADIEFLIIRPKYSLLAFAATEYIRIEILNATKKHRDIPIVFDCRHLHGKLLLHFTCFGQVFIFLNF